MKKEEQIRMLLNSEQYTEEQLDKMLEDSHIPAPNVDKEWQRFKTRTQAKQAKQHRSKPMQWAATLAILAALSGISYAAIYHLALKEKEETLSPLPLKVGEPEGTIKSPFKGDIEGQDTIRTAQNFNNVQLETIMNQLNKDFGVKVVFNNENARKIRLYLSWEADDKLQDIVNRINHFEKVHLTLSDKTITIE